MAYTSEHLNNVEICGDDVYIYREDYSGNNCCLTMTLADYKKEFGAEGAQGPPEGGFVALPEDGTELNMGFLADDNNSDAEDYSEGGWSTLSMETDFVEDVPNALLVTMVTPDWRVYAF